MIKINKGKRANDIYKILFRYFGQIEMQKDKLGIFYSKFVVLNQDKLIKATLEIMGEKIKGVK